MNKGMVALIVVALIFIGTGIGGMVYYGGFDTMRGGFDFDRLDAPKDVPAQGGADNPNDQDGYYHMGRGHMFDGDEDEDGYGMMPFGRGRDSDNDRGGFRGNFDDDEFEHCYEEFNK